MPAQPVNSATTAPSGGPAVNGHEVLEKVRDLPISTWRYVWDEPHVRHLGPMSQDWAAAFGLGGDEKSIACVDANGVALVCIQALERQLAAVRDEVESLHAEVLQLRGTMP